MSAGWDADLEKARELLDGHGLTPADEGLVYSIAAAFDDEREKARAPFLALADEFDGLAKNPGWYGQHYEALTNRIRRALDPS